MFWPQLALSQDDDKPRDIQALIRQLDGNDPEAQEDALDDLRYVGVAALPALPALTKVVAGSDTIRRQTALEILGGIGPPAAAAVPVMANVLKDPNTGVRIAAAEALLRIAPDHAGAVAALGGVLNAEDVKDRLWAAQSIAALGHLARQCESVLIEAAGDKDPSVRHLIAGALGRIGPPPRERALAALRRLLADDDAAVRVAAAGALWRLEEAADAVLPTLIRVLKDFRPGTETVPDYQIISDYPPARQAAAVLGEMGRDAPSAVESLLWACDQQHAGLRLAAIEAIGEIGPDARPAIDRLAKALRETEVYAVPLVHQSWCVSDEARIALSKIGPASSEALIAALKDKDERVRYNAVKALGEIQPGDDEAVAALAGLLADPNVALRGAAANALGQLGRRTASAAPKLAALLNDEGKWTAFPGGGGIGSNYELGDQLVTALKEIGAEPKEIVPAISESLQKDRRISRSMVDVLRWLGPKAVDAVPALEPLLSDPAQRLPAALALSRIVPEHKNLLEIFRTALLDRDSFTAVPAARGLGDLGPRASAALPDLLAELDREADPSAKSILAAAIVKIDPRQAKAVVELARGLRETPKRFRHAGHEEAAATWTALGKDAEPAADLLVSGLQYEVTDPTVEIFYKLREEASIRLRSAELLIDVSLHTKEAVVGLTELCESTDCGVRGGAADALARLGPAAIPAVSAFVAMLPDNELYVVGGNFYGHGGIQHFPGEHAARALAAIGEPAIPALRTALVDEEPITRERAALGLGLIGKPAAVATADLQRTSHDPCRAVRRAAEEALKKIESP